MSDELIIELEPETDRNGKTFYVGRLKAPVLIDCKEGATFIIFTSDPNSPELHICNTNKPKKNLE